MVRVQDDIRETIMINALGLIGGSSRINVDATTICGKLLELKSTSKGGVSTARDLGRRHLAKWRQCYWIIGTFKAGEDIITDYRFMAPCHLEGWFSKIERHFDRCDKERDYVVSALTKHGCPSDIIRSVTKRLDDGALLNDPNIPKGYVERNSIPMTGDLPTDLLALIEKYPITSGPLKKCDLTDLISFGEKNMLTPPMARV